MKASAWWPFFCVGIIAVVMIALVICFFKFGIPFISKVLNTTLGENKLPVSTEPVILDLTGLAKEALLTSRNSNISQPCICGSKIYFAGGSDSYGGANLVWMNCYDTDTRTTTVIKQITRKNEMIMSIAATEGYIAYFDAYYNGGGTIYYYDIAGETTHFVANVGFGWPELAVTEGDSLVWTERSGTAYEKLYMYQIPSGELTTLAVFDNSPYGLSHPDACLDTIIWADADERKSDPSKYGKIMMIRLNNGAAQTVTYYADMYVHSPKTNGTVWAWMDTPGADGTALYISLDGTRPRKIDEGVTEYGVGDTFVAYGRGGAIWAYFFADGTVARLTNPGEYCSIADVRGDMVVWFDISDSSRERDILRYMHVTRGDK